jgi:hypothetical protein
MKQWVEKTITFRPTSYAFNENAGIVIQLRARYSEREVGQNH